MLTKLEIKSFPPLADGEVELKNLNVIIGANGVGKTSLLTYTAHKQNQPFYTFNALTMRGQLDYLQYSVAYSDELLPDCINLAPYLLRSQQTEPKVYREIERTVELIAPYFANFILEPVMSGKFVRLNWRQKETFAVQQPDRLSIGTLRFVCLTALLMPIIHQKAAMRPDIILLDNPETGLHPYAITLLGDMIKQASANAQVMLTTHSPDLLDCFEPDDIIIAERRGSTATFRRLDQTHIKRRQVDQWLGTGLSLGEIWKKNLLGARLTRTP